MKPDQVNDMLMGLGLGDDSTEPPKFEVLKSDQEPIDLLKPGSDHHTFVLQYLKDRIKTSEDAMSKFYPRWQIAERKFQAYLSLPDYEAQLRKMNDESKIPAPALILFPYKYAVIATIVTYGMTVFCGRDTYFPLGADSKEQADIVRFMEMMVQRHCEKSKMIARVWQTLLDGELYGVGILRGIWRTKKGNRTIIRPAGEAEILAMPDLAGKNVRDLEERIIWAGNDFVNIDPYMFFPDPNVPMSEVAERGEYVFWREFVGKHILIKAQKDGLLKYVETVQGDKGYEHDSKWWNLSHRSAISGGDSHAGDSRQKSNYAQDNTYMMDQGTVEIIPAELGLGPETTPQKWLFTVLNKCQIVGAEPLDYNHGNHPLRVSEPYNMGYGFGQPALGDYIGPIQDILSWFIDSHIYNVRAALNNQWVFDPSKIDEKSLKYSQPGKHIRLKPLAHGTDVRTAIQQLPVTDVTRGHMTDLSTFTRLGDMISAVNDTTRGVQPQGGRRTASETRIVGESALGRMGGHMRLISQQMFMPLIEDAVINIQQFQQADMWTKVIGAEAFGKWGEQLLTQDFTYPIHDGTLPLDKLQNFDTWKEILLGMAQSQILQQTHSFPRVFEHVCQLGGAANISSYRLVSDAEMDNLARMGAAIPLPQAPGNVPPMGPPQ